MNVNIEERTTELSTDSTKGYLWTLAGPLTLLLCFFVSIYKASSQTLYLELAAVIAIPLCWQWKTRGLLVSLLSVVILVASLWSRIEPGDHLWQLGYALSISLGLVITALGFEEAKHSFPRFERPEIGIEENDWDAERESLQTQIGKLKIDLDDREAKIRSLSQSPSEISFQELLKEKEQIIAEHELAIKEIQEDLWALQDKEKVHLDEYHRELNRQAAASEEVLKQREASLAEQEKTISAVQSELWTLRERERQQETTFEALLSEKEKLLEISESKYRAIQNELQLKETELREEYERQLQQKQFLAQEEVKFRESTIEEQEIALREMQADLWTVKERGKQQFKDYQRDLQRQQTLASELIRDLKEKESRALDLLAQKEASENELTSSLIKAKRELEKIQHTASVLEEEKNRLYQLWQHESAELDLLRKQIEDETSRQSDSSETQSLKASNEAEVESLMQEIKVLREKEALYKQLKNQFAEKTDVLAQTRSELFHLEVKYLALQRDLEAQSLDPDPFQEKLIRSLLLTEKECFQKDQEVERLQELVSTLINH